MIESIMSSALNDYYLFIVLIFLVVKFFLFVMLWSWLRIRVSERMQNLTNKLKTNEQPEKRNFLSNSDRLGASDFHSHMLLSDSRKSRLNLYASSTSGTATDLGTSTDE